MTTYESTPPNPTRTHSQTRVAVPSDPAIPLTPAQLDAVFGGVNRLDSLRDLVRMLREKGAANDANAA